MTKKNTIAFQLLRAVAQQEVALAEERAAHLATRQELSMALAERAHARAEVERLRAERRALAERMREACAEYLKHWTYDEHTLSRVRATPLVTEER